jgi:hypothetical protein
VDGQGGGRISMEVRDLLTTVLRMMQKTGAYCNSSDPSVIPGAFCSYTHEIQTPYEWGHPKCDQIILIHRSKKENRTIFLWLPEVLPLIKGFGVKRLYVFDDHVIANNPLVMSVVLW